MGKKAMQERNPEAIRRAQIAKRLLFLMKSEKLSIKDIMAQIALSDWLTRKIVKAIKRHKNNKEIMKMLSPTTPVTIELLDKIRKLVQPIDKEVSHATKIDFQTLKRMRKSAPQLRVLGPIAEYLQNKALNNKYQSSESGN